MEAPAGNSEGGSNAPSREEFNTAIGDLSAKLESLMMTMSQVVHGTAPATTGDGRRGRVAKQQPLHPTIPQADLPEVSGEGTPHQGMYL